MGCSNPKKIIEHITPPQNNLVKLKNEEIPILKKKFNPILDKKLFILEGSSFNDHFEQIGKVGSGSIN